MRQRFITFLRWLNPFRVLRLLRYLWFRFSNWRRGRYRKMDYIEFRLPSRMPPLPEQRGFIQRQIMGDPPLSLRDLHRAFERIADDPRPAGVILHFTGMSMGMADLESLRDSIRLLRDRGKKVICYAQSYDTELYFVASAADQILLQPGGELFTLGLRQTVTYQRDALAAVGLEIEAVAITPYKSALETLANSEPSPEAEQQRNWLLDSRYRIIVDAIAAGRKMPEDAVRALIDSSPHLDNEALDEGYVDGVIAEDKLPEHLGVKHIARWELADDKLLKRWRKRPSRYVAILPIVGMIVPGESANPPVEPPVDLPLVTEPRAGDATVIQQVRRLRNDPRAAAVIVFVDSRGGSAAASEAMAAAIEELAKSRPVITYMHNVAASGGYYVATPTRWIVTQPGTITGSIGVISGKATTGALYDKLRLNRIEMTRGANADFLTDTRPLTPANRERMRQIVEHLYGQFIGRVAESRSMTREAVDAIAGGRVWTGKQALEYGLVDALGGLDVALKHARKLAKLPDDTPLVMTHPRDKTPIGPMLAEKANPAAWVRYVNDGIRLLYTGRALFMDADLIE